MLTKSMSALSLRLSSHLHLCFPLLSLFFSLCRAIIYSTVMWPKQISFCLLNMTRSSLCSAMTACIILRPSALITRTLYEIFTKLWFHLISKTCILFLDSIAKVHISQAYRKIAQETFCYLSKLASALLWLQWVVRSLREPRFGAVTI